jgi:hypothetical protein
MSNCIVSCCFTSQPCPQRKRKVRVCPEMMAGWCESIERLKLQGYILYDELPNETMNRFASDFVHFSHVCLDDSHCSLNDMRFFAYQELLDGWDLRDSFFFTDLFDVTIQHNPHPWMHEHGGLAFGTEFPIERARYLAPGWIEGGLDIAFPGWERRIHPSSHIVTAGLFGGMVPEVAAFLDIMCGLLQTVHLRLPDLNANMPCLQMVVRCLLGQEKVHFGPPLHAADWRFGGKDPNAFFHHTWQGMESTLFP